MDGKRAQHTSGGPLLPFPSQIICRKITGTSHRLALCSFPCPLCSRANLKVLILSQNQVWINTLPQKNSSSKVKTDAPDNALWKPQRLVTMQALALKETLRLKVHRGRRITKRTSLFKFPPAALNNQGQTKDCRQKPMRQPSPFELHGVRKIHSLRGIYIIAFKNVLEKVTPVNSKSAHWRMFEHCFSKTTGLLGPQRVWWAVL